MQGRLEISTDLFIEILKGLQCGEAPRMFRVAKNALPADVEFVRAEHLDDKQTIALILRSDTLKVTNGIVDPPWVETVYQEEATCKA